MPSPTPEAWAQIRYEYEQTRRSVEDICLAYGTTPNTLRRRGRLWGWRMRHPPIPDQGPEAVPPPGMTDAETGNAPDLQFLGPRLRGDEREESTTHSQACTLTAEATTPTLPACGERSPDDEPSPHITPAPTTAAPDDPRPIGERLQGAVAHVLPAIETTLARLAAGPVRPREMELAARALGSLMRTLRELNGLLSQYHPAQPPDDDPPPDDIDDMRNELARRIEAMVASERDAIPRRYEAGWNEFAAEAAAAART